jgi:voltage-gated potassium channel
MDTAPTPEAIAFGRPAQGWRRRWFSVIFEADTLAGRRFDLILLVAVLTSVLVVMLETVEGVATRYGPQVQAIEWAFTIVFTAEYVARLACVDRPLRYARSFFGVVDLASVLPMYLAAFVPGLHVLIDIRVLRMLRVFRILKLTEYMREHTALAESLAASRRKIAVFLAAVAMVVVVLGTVMYVVEGPANGFTSIPIAVYWAITTMTTVGFGDITPKTDLGRAVAGVVMLLGWGILAVPTGIVTAEMTSRRMSGDDAARPCAACGTRGHQRGARFCHRCGAALAA